MRFLLCDSIEEKDICTNIFIKRQRLSSDFIWIITMFSLTYLVLMATKLIGWIDCNVSRAGFLCMQLLRASCLKGPCTQLNALLSLFWENRKAKKEGKEGKGPVPKITYTLIHYIYWYSKQAYEWQHQSLPFYKSVSGASKILRKLLSSHTW